MSKFYNLEGQSVVVEAALDDLRPVHEGWGEAIGNLVSMFVPAVAGTLAGKMAGEKIGGNGLIGGFLGGAGGYILGFLSGVTGLILFNAATAKKFIKIIEHPKVKEYLLQEADKIYKEVKKKDKSVVTKWDDKDKDLEKAAEKGELDVPGFMSSFKYMKDAEIEVGQYSILLMGDHEELKRIVLVLYSNNAYHLILKDITVPSKEQINEWLKEEAPAKESMEVATEGWGAALAKLLGFSAVGAPLSTIFTKLHLKILTNPDDDFTTMAKKSIAAGVCGLVLNIAADIAANKAIDLQASKKLLEALNKPEMVEHIKTEAAKAFKELKKEHKSLTLDVENALKEKANTKEASKDERGFITRFLTYYAKCTAKIDKYTVFATGDFKSFDSLYVIFFDEEEGKIIRKALPIPSVKAEEAPKEEA